MVAKVEWHDGELFPMVGFIVPKLSARPKWSSGSGGQVRPELDAALLLSVCSPNYRCSSNSFLWSTPPGELSALAGLAQGSQGLVIAQLSSQVDKDGVSTISRLVEFFNDMWQSYETLIQANCL